MTQELTVQQLSALGRVHDLLEEAGIAYWLFGGWAVDFYVGSVTRAHDDLDLAVWLTDLPRIAQLLEDDGWRHAPLDDEDGGTGHERGAVRLELTYLIRDGDGSVFTPLRHGRAQWSEDALANDVGELRGVRAHLVGLAPLRMASRRLAMILTTRRRIALISDSCPGLAPEATGVDYERQLCDSPAV